MKHLLIGVAVLALVVSAGADSVPTAKPEDVGLSAQRLQRISTAMRDYIEAGEIAGVVTLVARRGRIAHFEAQGMANIETKRSMTKDAIFRLASMSKPITGAAVLMLVEEGKLRLNDPVSRFIPEFRNPTVAVTGPAAVAAAREITVFDLLTHTSGLVSGGLGAGAAPQRLPTDTLASYSPKLGAVPLDFQPGTLWRDSGSAGFDVLSRIVEIVSRQSFDGFLQQRLFEPLGMKDTGFVPGAAQASRLAMLYQRGPNGLVAAPRESTTTYFSGAGGLMSTAEDYLQFAQMMLKGGTLNGRRYLSPRTVDLMIANHTGDMVNGQFGRPPRGMGFGLSVQVVTDPVAAGLRVSQGGYGWAGGTGVSFWIEPQEQLVSLFLIQGSGGGARPAFENAVRQAIVE